MLVIDVNILVYAVDALSPFHRNIRRWWEMSLNQEPVIGLPWATILGFIRVTTSSRVMISPRSVDDVVNLVENWLSLPNVEIPVPGQRHAAIIFNLLREVGVGGNLTTDAHLAALAIEYQGRLVSTDHDFSRFTGLRWFDPTSAQKRR